MKNSILYDRFIVLTLAITVLVLSVQTFGYSQDIDLSEFIETQTVVLPPEIRATL